MSQEKADAQMRKGLLEFCVLLLVSKEPKYASELLTDLKAANLLVVEGTLYPLLNRLKRSGVLSYEWKESLSGPPRKYYGLTDEGQQLLEQLQSSWNSLQTSINSIVSHYE